jgi:hypothetical protein
MYDDQMRLIHLPDVKSQVDDSINPSTKVFERHPIID